MTSRIETEYERIRAGHRAELNRRLSDISLRVPELQVIADERAALVSAVGAGKLSPSEALENHRLLTAREAELMRLNGITREDMQLHYTCEKCRDTGWLGSGLKQPCSCRLIKEALLDEKHAINARETFETFDASLFADDNQRVLSCKVRDFCLGFADALPSPEKPFLLILGDTGLGKSFFGNAIAYRALERGIPAMRVTAYDWLQGVLDGMRDNGTPESSAIRTPLLSLDDLGSEPNIPNISNEHLFALINDRMTSRRPTVIGTNLNPQQLRDRYGDRIYMRLTDRTLVTIIQLKGESLRGRVRPC